MFSNEKKNRVYNKAQLIDIIFKESSYVCVCTFIIRTVGGGIKRVQEREDRRESQFWVDQGSQGAQI